MASKRKKVITYKETGLPYIKISGKGITQGADSLKPYFGQTLNITEISMPKKEIPVTRIHTEDFVLALQKPGVKYKAMFSEIVQQFRAFASDKEQGDSWDTYSLTVCISEDLQITVDAGEDAVVYKCLYDGWYRLEDIDEGNSYF